MEHKSRRRSREEVLGEIIRAANDGAIKTRIMYRAALNSRQLKRYLQTLIKQGLLEYNDKQKVFISTEKGKMYLARLDEFLKAKSQLQDQSRALKEFLRPESP